MGLTREQAFPSKYLKAGDLPQPVNVTIREWTQDTIGQDDDKRLVVILFFDEVEKGLILNNVNWLSIESLYGNDTDLWIGKRVKLYKTKTKMGGNVVDCVRVLPPDGVAAPAPTAPASDRDKLAAIVAKHNPSEADYKQAIGHPTLGAFKSAGGTAAEALEKLTAYYASPNGGDLDDLPF